MVRDLYATIIRKSKNTKPRASIDKSCPSEDNNFVLMTISRNERLMINEKHKCLFRSGIQMLPEIWGKLAAINGRYYFG